MSLILILIFYLYDDRLGSFGYGTSKRLINVNDGDKVFGADVSSVSSVSS
jgi:hypothetical protein